MEPTIVITRQDAKRLRELLDHPEVGTPPAVQESLGEKLAHATIVASSTIPRDIVTLYSVVRVRNVTSGRLFDCILALPAEADPGSDRLSVLAPLGVALLGRREGDDVRVPIPAGRLHFRIERILHQPEASRRAAMGGAA